MFNFRVILASMVSFVLVTVVMSLLMGHGSDKVLPIIEKNKAQAEAQRQKINETIRQELADLGAEYPEENEKIQQMIENNYPELLLGQRPLRPLGTWMGVCKGENNRIAFLEFTRNRYKMLVKTPGGKDIKEKGEYEFEFDSIIFEPDGQPQYTMDYYMASPQAIQLYGHGLSFHLEKDKSVEFDF